MTNALGVEIIFLTRDGDESILLQNWIESKLGNKYTRALIFWISSWSMDLWCKHMG